jgi:LDH2 family malate/lactate/ureidoglycolate dehydrogenase
MAYAVPAMPHKPVFFDIATSKIAGMKVNRAKMAGETLPDECIVDADGLPTNDPSTPNWALYPMGGHKGYGLALMIEILSSVLTGGRMLDIPLWTDLPVQDQVTHALFLINIAEIIGTDTFTERMQFIIQSIVNAPKAKGSDRIYLPGEIEWEKFEKAEREGLPLPDDVYDSARKLADWHGLDIKSCFI